MNQMSMTLMENRLLAEGIRRLTLSGEGLEEQRPGQFLNIRLNGLFLRRPISVCDWEPGQVTVMRYSHCCFSPIPIKAAE